MRSFIWRACLPTFLSILLFSVAVFGIILPALERTFMDQKREMIRELATSAWNILAKLENDVQAGGKTREEAQRQAVDQVRSLHYGQEMKDYFWINDLHPRMIIHPYRPELNGKDLTEFADAKGKRLFVEMANVVKAQGAGYVDYMWQWKDNSSRIVPKLSYVKGFEPWGWIIGTGVYIQDVQEEIRAVRANLVIASLAVLVFASLLLTWLLVDHYRSESGRRQAQKALSASEERYRLVVESSGECLLLALEGQPLFANQSMLHFLGCTQEDVAQRHLEDLLLPSKEEARAGRRHLQDLREGRQAPLKYEAALRLPSGEERPVAITLSPIAVQDRAGIIAVAADLTARREDEIRRSWVRQEFLGALHFLQQKAREVCSPSPLRLPSETPVSQALAYLAREGQEMAVLETSVPGPVALGPGSGAIEPRGTPQHSPDGPPGEGVPQGSPGQVALGPVSGAFEPRVPQGSPGEILGFAPPQNPALRDWLESQAADVPIWKLSAPVTRIPADAGLWEAFLIMEGQRFSPGIVVGSDGETVGFLTWRHLLQVQRFSPLLMEKDVARAATVAEVQEAVRRLPEMIRVFMSHGAHPFLANQVITHLADVVLRRVIDLALAEVGLPPVPFVFLVMGSQGRGEQTLKTDQDNAIIFRDVPPADEPQVMAYFQELGRRVCDALNRTGYAYCVGAVMASNAKWCQPLAIWKTHFRGWVNTLEAEDLLQTKIFFDFRGAWGDETLVRELREELWTMLADHPRFFSLLARNVLLFKPPVGLFGNFLPEDQKAHGNAIDIKGAMSLIVDFARIYALKHHVAATSTEERVAALVARNVFPQASGDELIQAYRYLMDFRLNHQVRQVADGKPVDNFVDPYGLTAIDQRMLKEVFAQIQHFQVRLSYDFTGMMYQV